MTVDAASCQLTQPDEERYHIQFTVTPLYEAVDQMCGDSSIGDSSLANTGTQGSMRSVSTHEDSDYVVIDNSYSITNRDGSSRR